MPNLTSSITPSTSGSASPDYLNEPGPSGIAELQRASLPVVPPVTPEAVQPYPKAPKRSAAKGRAKIKACILTEDPEAIDMLTEKEKKKVEKLEKKKVAEQKKKEREAARKQKEESGPPKKKSKRVTEESSDEEDDDPDAVPLPPSLVDDSSEGSEEDFRDEEALEVYTTAWSYPFVEKEPEVRDCKFKSNFFAQCLLHLKFNFFAYGKPHLKLTFLPNVS